MVSAPVFPDEIKAIRKIQNIDYTSSQYHSAMGGQVSFIIDLFSPGIESVRVTGLSIVG